MKVIKIGYFVKAHGQTMEDVVYFDRIKIGSNLEDALEDLAEMACEHAWGHNDGWEWLHEGVSIITLVGDGKELGDFEIEVGHTPLFTVRKIK